MKHFEGRVAVITGAGSGLGREFANTAAGLGMKLVLADIDAAALERASGELHTGGAEVLAMVADVRIGSHVEELADAAMTRFHGVHLVFNNAGVGMGGLIWESTVADWEWVLGVNLWGVIHGVRVFTPLMLECARRDPGYEGHIVNTASMAGLLNPPAMGAYNASKHAVVSLTETLYHDLRLVDSTLQASVLCPFFTPTGIADSEVHRPHELDNDAAADGQPASGPRHDRQGGRIRQGIRRRRRPHHLRRHPRRPLLYLFAPADAVRRERAHGGDRARQAAGGSVRGHAAAYADAEGGFDAPLTSSSRPRSQR
jgi:NAD(P)-dependent dehydrogenase (short-subunit alcohol dehydrogenase family)